MTQIKGQILVLIISFFFFLAYKNVNKCLFMSIHMQNFEGLF